VLWRSGHIVQITDGRGPVWRRKAGRNRKLLRSYLAKAAVLRQQMAAA
jgi:hypothetical protein